MHSYLKYFAATYSGRGVRNQSPPLHFLYTVSFAPFTVLTVSYEFNSGIYSATYDKKSDNYERQPTEKGWFKYYPDQYPTNETEQNSFERVRKEQLADIHANLLTGSLHRLLTVNFFQSVNVSRKITSDYLFINFSSWRHYIYKITHQMSISFLLYVFSFTLFYATM